MSINIVELPSDTHSPSNITCSNCRACCCRLEVMLITDTGVPKELIEKDQWGGEIMKRLDDGWCAAVDRDTLMCTIYENRPWICREFEMASYECETERKDNEIDPR
ncbi:YkgJ family cysteine cluster protein [Aliivibrio fischeri]|uniref:YkgJ family cysteine cluster protein n=1 Tax=Aliivibrio fischeri TaxID=668 RepID=UPI00132AF284|nr:YkgJ family cysteine cluster protein [Aliivibrio fischeri]MUL21506.1 YkgJ family cysteine cluster protein [Aliivibrio fischeri]MUL23471.1 YkgJ family cysteine cluster protein [Aliivibrio fischeri]